MKTRLRTYFLAGLLALIPLVVTVGILSWLFNLLDGFLGPYIYEWLGHPMPGLGLIATLVVVFVIGVVATNIAGRRILTTLDEVLHRIPLVRSIYSTTKQMSDSILQDGQVNFQHVVLVEYPRRGLYQIGFLTGRIEGPLQDALAARTGERLLNVFVPATPNPMSGYLVLLPERDVHVLPMSVQDGLTLVISGGLATPHPPQELHPRREEGAAS